MMERLSEITMMCYSRNWVLLMLVLLLLSHMVRSQNDCNEVRCGRHGPRVRFPFRLKDKQSDNCAYPRPAFHLTCTSNHDTLLHLSTPSGSVNLSVRYIDYNSQTIQIYDSQGCLTAQFLKFHSSISPFIYQPLSGSRNFTLLNCSSIGKRYLNYRYDNIDYITNQNYGSFQPKQDMFSCPIYAELSYEYLGLSDLLSCSKIRDFSSNLTSIDDLRTNSLVFRWLNPNCSTCEANGKLCKLKNNATQDAIECVPRGPKISKSTIIAITASSLGAFVLLMVLLVLFLIYRHFRRISEDLARVQRFLEDYRTLKPTRFSYADLNRITDRFKDKIGEGGHGAVFKGKISNEILVAVKMLNNTDGDGKDFINEVGTLGKIHHVNVVRLLGFCADGYYRALVYDFFPNGSLQNCISTPDDKDVFLGWKKLQQIAIDIAKGIEYLHDGCDDRILHFDINPHNVLLDQSLTPKLSDFGLAKLCPKNQSTVSMTAARGTLGYIAPEVFSRNFGNVSYKSDIYSYGMLLIEMVGGRKNTSSQENFQVLYPEWIHNLVEGSDIHIPVEDEEDVRIAKKLAIVGLLCIQWHPIDRPSIRTVVQMLEGEGDKLKMPPTPFDSSSVNAGANANVPARRLNLELEVIHELE